MKRLVNGKFAVGLAIAMISLFSMSSCSEDVIDPDTSSMPPKSQIKTPPRKKN